MTETEVDLDALRPAGNFAKQSEASRAIAGGQKITREQYWKLARTAADVHTDGTHFYSYGSSGSGKGKPGDDFTLFLIDPDKTQIVPVETPTPSLRTARHVASTVSRRLREYGFPMAQPEGKPRRLTEGFHVGRVGCSNLVAVRYCGGSLFFNGFTEAQQAVRTEAHDLLRRIGYPVDESGHITCEKA